jgi:hypothetical protein
MTLSIMTFSILTLGIMNVFATLSKDTFSLTLSNPIMLSVVKLNVVLNVILRLCLLNTSFKGAMTLSIMTFSITTLSIMNSEFDELSVGLKCVVPLRT